MRILLFLALLLPVHAYAGTSDYGRWQHQVQGYTEDLSNPWKACLSYLKYSSGYSNHHTTYLSGTVGQTGWKQTCKATHTSRSGSVTQVNNGGYITFGIVNSNTAPTCPGGTEYDSSATPKGCYFAPTCTAGENPVNARYTEPEIKSGAAEYVQFEGCMYEFAGPINCSVGADEVTSCDMEYIQDGVRANSQPANTPLLNPAATAQPLPTTKDNRETTTESELLSETSESAPDGTVTETKAEQVTDIKNKGTIIWNEGDKLIVQNSDGSTTETQLTTTTVTNPDGSKIVTQHTEYTYTPPTKSTSTFQPTVPRFSNNTSVSGNPATGSKTTTTTYSSTGQQTGQTSTATGTDAGAGLGDEECTGPDCEPTEEGSAAGQPEFDSGDGSWWESDYPDGLSGIWASKQAALNDNELSSWLNSFNFANGGSVPTWSVSMNTGLVDFGSFDLEVPNYVWTFIGLCILLTSLFTARKLIFGG